MALKDNELLTYTKIFEALGQESRLEVFNFICQSGEKGVRPKEIIGALGIDGGTLHFHLNRLMAVNLIATKKNGPRGVYRRNENIPTELVLLFDGNQQGMRLEASDVT